MEKLCGEGGRIYENLTVEREVENTSRSGNGFHNTVGRENAKGYII